MNDLNAYIETGILELYVLGDVTPDERLQVEDMMSKHPAIKAEVTAIEMAMEAYAEANAVMPAANNRDKILNSTLTNLADDRTFVTKQKPVVKDNVIQMQPVVKQNNFYKYAFAASVALLLASIVALFNMHNQLEQSNMQLAVLAGQNQQFAKTASFKDDQLNLKNNQLQQASSKLAALANNQPVKTDNFKNEHLVIFKDTSFKLMRLKPVPSAKNQSANLMIAWSAAKKKVIIDMIASNMPKNDKEHQYQLWALVGGKPVDLGVFDNTGDDSAEMVKMKSIGTADAFAVTLEPRGGSVNPTMSELMVLGK